MKIHIISGDHNHKYHSICCIPTFILVIVFVLCSVAITVLLSVYRPLPQLVTANTPVFSVIITLAIIIGLALIGNLYTWSRVFIALMRPQKRRVMRAIQQVGQPSNRFQNTRIICTEFQNKLHRNLLSDVIK